MDVNGFIVNMVEAKGVVLAATAATGAMFGMGMSWQAALQFGALSAVGASLGDALLTIGGANGQIETYLANSVFDPMDFAGAFAGSAGLNFAIGVQGQQLFMFAGIAGLAGVVAPKIAGQLLTMLMPTDPVQHTIINK